MKQCILILGPHRSGTSALAGALSKAGINFGRLVMPSGYDNPKGFYENEKIVSINEALLGVLLHSWDDPKSLPSNWIEIEEINVLIGRARKVITNEFGDSSLIGIKDPRLCLTLPFWKKVLDELGYESKVILNYRNPLEIVSSLRSRNGFSERHAHLLTWSYLLQAECDSRDNKRVFSRYQNLIIDPFVSISRILRDIDIEIEIKHARREIEQHITRDLYINKINETHNLDDSYMPYLTSIEGLDRDKDYNDIDQLRISHYRIVEEYQDSIRDNNIIQARLQLETQQGKMIILPPEEVSKETKRILFSVPTNTGSVNRIIFYPSNSELQLSLNEIEVKTINGIVEFRLSENSIHREGNTYFFDIEVPKIILDINPEEKLVEVLFMLTYHEFGKKVVIPRKNNANNKNNSAWGTALLTSLKRPWQLLSNINIKNFKTLQSAVKRESPRQILRNFTKLLNKKKTQQEVLTNDAKKSLHPPTNKSINKEGRLKIAYITPHLPDFDRSSGGRRALRLLEILSKYAHVVVISRDNSSSIYKAALRRLNIDVYGYDSIKEELKQIGIIDVLIYAWYYTYYDETKWREIFPYARVIIDTVDVHWIRESRSIGDEDYSENRVFKNKVRELSAYAKADALWVVSSSDKDAVLKELPRASVQIVSNIHDIILTETTIPDIPTLLFFGNYNHHPNLSAVRKLVLEIFPLVKKKFGNVQLIVAGANATKEIEELCQVAGVIFKGYVDEKEIQELYESSTLAVAPLMAGAGVKGKILESIAYMTPVVTNAIGNEGIGLVHQESGLLAEDAKDFGELICKAFKGGYNLEFIAKKAQDTMLSLASPSVVETAAIDSLFKCIDILIVTYNRLELLKSCVESIVKYTIYPRYKIIVYSNGCDDGTKEYLEILMLSEKRLEVVWSTDNHVFVRPNNEMMSLYKNDDVILLNNDTTVTHGWLEALFKSAYRHSKIGIVGSKILYPDGRLQEFGSEIYEDGSGMNYGKGGDSNDPEYNLAQVVPYVSGCSIYIKRATIKKIGVFDDQFHPCYYEDSDYCYRAWEKDLYTVVIPESIVYHHEGASAGRDESVGFKKYQVINKEKFLQLHGSDMSAVNNKVKKAGKEVQKYLN